MFSDRWVLLKEMIDESLITTPDRTLTHSQCLQLFHAFLLQVKENEGIVYIIPSESNEPLATHFASALTSILSIPARGLIPMYKEVMLHLALLLKKTDLIIALCDLEISQNILSAAAMAKERDVPLITLTGGNNNPLAKRGDLNIYFNKTDRDLIQTGQFSLLTSIVDSWSYDLESAMPEQELFLSQIRPQTMLTGLRL